MGDRVNPISSEFRFNPRYQSGNQLPVSRNVLDFTPFILDDGSYKKNYLMYSGSWIKLNVTPDDDLRVKTLGIGLQDSDEILYDITLKDEGVFSHTGYSEGNYKFDGKGFYIDFDNSYADKSYLEVDNMMVRSTLTVYEFLVMQKRFSAGSLAVSPGGGKVASVSGTGSTTVTFEDPSALGVCSFAANDILISKRVAPDKTTVLRSVEAVVSSVSGNSVVVVYTTGTFQKGDEVVCVGNTTDTSRQGLIYISADDSGAPFLDVDSGVNSLAAWSSTTKVQARLGNLAGYTSATFGALTGYGLFIKDNLYIEKGYIALGSGGYVRAGKTSYVDTTAGFWIGNDGGVPKISIGNSTNQLRWDGTNLSITGGIAGNKTYRSLSSSPPATPATNDLWFQTDTGLFKQYNGNIWENATDATVSALTSGVTISAGGIVLGTSSSLKSGKSSYADATAGWWIGINSSTPQINVGSSANYFKWTGTAVQIKGEITLTNTTTFANGEKLGLDDVADGSSYARVLSTDIQAGHIKLSEAVGTLDDITDGTGYGKIAITDIQSGHIKLITAVGTLDDIDDGTNYQRVASTDLSAGHITVVASTASININSTTFGNQGIQLQYNGGTPRFYVGNGSTKYIKFDGTNVSMGEGTITGGTIQTATTNQRIVINEGGTAQNIKFYSSTDSYNGNISAATNVEIGGSSLTLNSWVNSDLTISTDSGGTGDIIINNGGNGSILLNSAIEIDYSGNLATTGIINANGNFNAGDSKLTINTTGQIIKVNNIAASGNTGKGLVSDGTSFTPTTVVRSLSFGSTVLTYYVATSSGGSPTEAVQLKALIADGTTIGYILTD